MIMHKECSLCQYFIKRKLIKKTVLLDLSFLFIFSSILKISNIFSFCKRFSQFVFYPYSLVSSNSRSRVTLCRGEPSQHLEECGTRIQVYKYPPYLERFQDASQQTFRQMLYIAHTCLIKLWVKSDYNFLSVRRKK